MDNHKTFNMKRLGNLMSHDLLLNHKRYLFTLAGAFLGIYILLFFNMYFAYSSYGIYKYAPYLILAVVALGGFVGMSFPDFSEKKRTADYLLLPASAFEKFMSQFIIRILIGTIATLVIFWLAAHLARFSVLSVKPSYDYFGEPFTITSFKYTELFQYMRWFDFLLLFTIILSIGTYLFSARLFFKRFALVKSLICGFALFILFLLVMVVFSHLFYPETRGLSIESEYFSVAKFTIGDHTTYMDWDEIFVRIFFSISWVFFLVIGYFKVKEKEV